MYIKKGIITSVLVFLLINLFSVVCNADEIQENEKSDKFKVVGYYSGDLFDEPLENLQTDKLTHVIYAFLIPKEDGTLVDLQKPQQFNSYFIK